LVPMLWRYRRTVGTAGATRLGRLTAVVSLGYFSIWAAFGLLVFPLGAALAEVAMRLPAVARLAPRAAGLTVVTAGLLQFTAWKARQLDRCRETPGGGAMLRADAATAWRYGTRLGLHCSYCCCGLTASLLLIGVMNPCAMAIVTVAVNAERLAGKRVARAIGAAVMAAGFVLILRASGLA